eukprot:TRINITY_DN6627_c0_g1_i5.p1 TRINITY_DN6627_c0_g1~~TRINITY_DN6627_c0_g1_i5.p1  ORF type:complete len:118 (+),score=12.27 TRINITY_DN6627_c0_g1_i5:2-355(+)
MLRSLVGSEMCIRDRPSGIYTVQEFVQYYMADVVKTYNFFGLFEIKTSEPATSMFFLFLLIGAIFTSFISVWISDRLGSKRLVFIAGIIQAVSLLPFYFFHQFQVTLLVGFVFGLGK